MAALQFKTITAEKFDAMGREAKERLAANDFESKKEEKELKITVEQHWVWQQIDGHMQFDVANDVSESNVLAFIDMRTKGKFVNIAHLTKDRVNDVIHAGKHEREHENNCICNLPVKEKVQAPKLVEIEKVAGISGIAANDNELLAEGFNEAVTEDNAGKTFANSGYKKQVRIARGISAATDKILGISALETFHNAAGDVKKVVDLVSKLGDAVLMLKAKAKMTPRLLREWVGGSGVNDGKIEARVALMIKENPPTVNNDAEALSALRKLVETVAEEFRVRDGLKKGGKVHDLAERTGLAA